MFSTSIESAWDNKNDFKSSISQQRHTLKFWYKMNMIPSFFSIKILSFQNKAMSLPASLLTMRFTLQGLNVWLNQKKMFQISIT